MKFLAITLFLLAGMLLSGCGKADPVGKWTGISENRKAPIPLELRADHTFNLDVGIPLSGTWTQSGAAVTLTVTNMLGKDIAADKQKALALTLSGNTLTSDSSGGMVGKLTFTRA